jgi:hypothetical protein
MFTYIKYMPTNPVVVEGYSPGETTAERFRVLRMRAGLVREYSRGRYDVPSQDLGYIGLGQRALGSPTKDRWDGVAVTPFLDRGGLQVANTAKR